MPEKNDQKTITHEEIRNAISRSGYLIEHRVAQRLSMSGYYVMMNLSFLDPFTDKTREIDLQADSTYTTSHNSSGFAQGVHWSIICECENNSQPIVFFPYETVAPGDRCILAKCFGVPMKIWKNDEYISLCRFLPLKGLHHYCQAEIASQYCTFIRSKRSYSADWIAAHSEEQHDTFNSLIYSIENEITDFYSNWELPEHDNEEPVYIEFRFPLVVLGGRLLEARLGRTRLKLKRVKHIKYMRTVYLKGKEETYIIDVITEDYLSEYISLVSDEMNKIKRIISRQKKVLDDSILRLLEDVRPAEPIADNYKQILHVL